MKYIDCCNHYNNDIVNRFSKAKSIDNFFTVEEIDTLRLYQFQNSKRVKMQPSSSNIQPVVSMTKMMSDLPDITAKFKDLLGDFAKVHTGNYFITSQLHDAHVDLISQDEEINNSWITNLIPYKSVIIPLFLTKGSQACTAFMNQRRIGYSVIFDKDYLSGDESSMYEILRSYNGLIDINGTPTDDNLDLNQWTETKYPQITKNNFKGFSEEIVIEQKIRSLIVFDSCQIHASCNLTGDNYTWIKNAINIQFYKEHK